MLILALRTTIPSFFLSTTRMEGVTPPVGRNIPEMIRQTKAFQHVRKTGEVTPSGWQSGKATLKPGPDLGKKVWKVWKPDMAF
jgi:alkyl hydroperoxide reductase subunit AhpC